MFEQTDSEICTDYTQCVLCQSACPVGTEAWKYIAYIQRGELEKAYIAIREQNPFPSVCARVCHHPCEKNCRLGAISSNPVAIRALKRFVTDRINPAIFTKEIILRSQALRLELSNEQEKCKVAVIGAGPAGITAANELALKG